MFFNEYVMNKDAIDDMEQPEYSNGYLIHN